MESETCQINIWGRAFKFGRGTYTTSIPHELRRSLKQLTLTLSFIIPPPAAFIHNTHPLHSLLTLINYVPPPPVDVFHMANPPEFLLGTPGRPESSSCCFKLLPRLNCAAEMGSSPLTGGFTPASRPPATLVTVTDGIPWPERRSAPLSMSLSSWPRRRPALIPPPLVGVGVVAVWRTPPTVSLSVPVPVPEPGDESLILRRTWKLLASAGADLRRDRADRPPVVPLDLAPPPPPPPLLLSPPTPPPP
jgi:hypothetical protein